MDHDHNTGRVRALLCYLCNKYLGQWEGDPIAAHNAAIYLAAIARDYDPLYEPRLSPPLPMEPQGRPQLRLRLPPIRVPA